MHKTIQPDGWKPAKGYSNGILANGRALYIGGQIGWNSDQIFECTDFVGQFRQALCNISDIVQKAGGRPDDIVRMTWFVTDKRGYLAKQKQVGEVYREIMGRHFPAMSVVVVSALIEDQALVEIEATAVIAK